MFSYLIIATAFLHVCLGASTSKSEHPCPSLDNDCIVKYFSEHAKEGCRQLQTKPEHGLLVKRSDVYFPILNCTVQRHNISAVHADDAKITAFLVDKETDFTILTITYTDLIVTIDKAEVIYYRTAQPPIYTSVNSTTLLERFDLTVYFKGTDKIDLRDSLTFAAVSGRNSITNTTPTLQSYKGSKFEALFNKVANDYPGYVQELEAPPQALAFSAFWIQHNICNFDLHVE